MPSFAGVFVDNETGPAAAREARFVNLGELPGIADSAPDQSESRSPVEVENTWISPGRGTTCSWAPFSGT
ncbi:hypothetical protein QFZ74_002831 [Streptomyces sp. V3I7]|nr:hypothetical protein [Streptomyces sp. V3I7]